MSVHVSEALPEHLPSVEEIKAELEQVRAQIEHLPDDVKAQIVNPFDHPELREGNVYPLDVHRARKLGAGAVDLSDRPEPGSPGSFNKWGRFIPLYLAAK